MPATQVHCMSLGMTGNWWGPRTVGGPPESWKMFYYRSCNEKIAVEDLNSLLV